MRPRNHLGKAKVDQLEVTVTIQQEVLELEVAVCNLQRAEALEGTRDLCHVHRSGILCERALPL